MKGVHILDSRYIIYKREEDFQAAIKMFKKALEIDPNYINAYSGLVYAYELHWEFTGETKQDLEMLINYAEKTYSLAPNSILAISNIAGLKKSIPMIHISPTGKPYYPPQRVKKTKHCHFITREIGMACKFIHYWE